MVLAFEIFFAVLMLPKANSTRDIHNLMLEKQDIAITCIVLSETVICYVLMSSRLQNMAEGSVTLIPVNLSG